MDQVIAIAKLIIAAHLLMAGALIVGVWIGRTSCSCEDR